MRTRRCRCVTSPRSRRPRSRRLSDMGARGSRHGLQRARRVCCPTLRRGRAMPHSWRVRGRPCAGMVAIRSGERADEQPQRQRPGEHAGEHPMLSQPPAHPTSAAEPAQRRSTSRIGTAPARRTAVSGEHILDPHHELLARGLELDRGLVLERACRRVDRGRPLAQRLGRRRECGLARRLSGDDRRRCGLHRRGRTLGDALLASPPCLHRRRSVG